MLYLKGRDKGRGLCYFNNIVCCLLLFLTQISISHGAAPGDANDDGKISQSDIGAVVNHTSLARNPLPAIRTATPTQRLTFGM